MPPKKMPAAGLLRHARRRTIESVAFCGGDASHRSSRPALSCCFSCDHTTMSAISAPPMWRADDERWGRGSNRQVKRGPLVVARGRGRLSRELFVAVLLSGRSPWAR
uniref:Uncharacterized protein n=1 Tax=Plectus sambesii TaxID=2011161 RepID=A0A914XKJ9_9BILA